MTNDLSVVLSKVQYLLKAGWEMTEQFLNACSGSYV